MRTTCFSLVLIALTVACASEEPRPLPRQWGANPDRCNPVAYIANGTIWLRTLEDLEPKRVMRSGRRAGSEVASRGL